MNLPLKLSILKSGKSQRRVAAEAEVSENRLSEIVCGWTAARECEREALVRVRGVRIDQLFGDGATVEIRSACPRM